MRKVRQKNTFLVNSQRFFTKKIKIVISIIFIFSLKSSVVYSESDNKVAYFDHYNHGIGSHGSMPLCTDGIDNDSDGRVDYDDIGCNDSKKHKRALTCKSCHGKNGNKRIKHKDCSTCHDLGKIYSRNGGPGVPYCRSCHLNERVFRFPPYKHSAGKARFNKFQPEGGWSDMTLPKFSHELHSSWMTCNQCHQALSPKLQMNEKQKEEYLRKAVDRRKPQRGHVFNVGFQKVKHKACATCHQKKLRKQPKIYPQMSDCTGCHQFGTYMEIPIHRSAQTTGIFSHRQHGKIINSPLPCKLCHTSTGLDPRNQRVQLPFMSSCGNCHDDKQAFGIEDPNSCNNCHIKGFKP